MPEGAGKISSGETPAQAESQWWHGPGAPGGTLAPFEWLLFAGSKWRPIAEDVGVCVGAGGPQCQSQCIKNVIAVDGPSVLWVATGTPKCNVTCLTCVR